MATNILKQGHHDPKNNLGIMVSLSRNPVFIRTLQWAWDRGSTGFLMSEIKAGVAMTEEEWTWVQRMMFGEIDGDPPLIYHLGAHHQGGGEYRYFITGSGASALINYLELKEARESSRAAIKWATASFVLAAVVGLTQIIIGVVQIHPSTPSASSLHTASY